MKVLIEGQRYKVNTLEKIFDTAQFYNINRDEGAINTVGYYHNFNTGDIVYMLPKVFMIDDECSVFGLSKEELLDISFSSSITSDEKLSWVRHLSVLFYKSLIEYKKRSYNQARLERGEVANLRSNIADKEFSFLDLLLSFINYYKKNKEQIAFLTKEYKERNHRKVSWEKTVMQNIPFLTSKNKPIYDSAINEKRHINREEELFYIFYSILNYLDKEHNLNLNFRFSLDYVPHRKFELKKSTLSKRLKRIKSNYFSDRLKRMVKLCELYFQIDNKAQVKNKLNDFIVVDSYNIVFEDMIDKLVAKSGDEIGREDGGGIVAEMKLNKDGKIIDHIYDYQSLIDTSNIFYIGDSKYYKPDSSASRLSDYKQITYAKNIIQYNIDIFNSGEPPICEARYRDEITEGYNITPNFFIYGHISDYNNYIDSNISERGRPTKTYHFNERLFDRDTLFIHKYQINFLFVLRAYVEMNNLQLKKFKNSVKTQFRKNFIDYFNGEYGEFEYSFYRKKISEDEFKSTIEFINNNFKQLNGKCIVTKDNYFVIAKHKNDSSLNSILNEFESFDLI